MRRTALAALLLLAVSGCGAARQSAESKFKGEQAKVAKVVDDLATAGRRRDAKTICDRILSSALRNEVANAGGNCNDEMKRAIDDADDFDLQVRSVKVTADKATAEVRQGKDGPVTTFEFVREGGSWRASALGG